MDLPTAGAAGTRLQARNLALLAVSLIATACGTVTPPGPAIPEDAALVVVNRTVTPLAMTDDRRVEACGVTAFTQDDVVALSKEHPIALLIGPGQAGAGKTAYTLPERASETEASASPVIVVVTAEGVEFTNSLDPASMPACEGVARPEG